MIQKKSTVEFLKKKHLANNCKIPGLAINVKYKTRAEKEGKNTLNDMYGLHEQKKTLYHKH